MKISKLVRLMLRAADVLAIPFVLAAAILMRTIRRAGVQHLPVSRHLLRAVGVFPIRRHYYEPLFDPRELRGPLERERALPGIDWNVAGQLQLLNEMRFASELADLPMKAVTGREFYLDNASFESGDAEFLYGLVRLKWPRQIVEVGCGFSSLMIQRALRMNATEGHACEHVCIEPYEVPWLESVFQRVIRARVEEVGLDLFGSLRANDILFIDSSHVIRPQGDVLFELLDVLPRLAVGVIVHVHDIFSPRDYLHEWIVDEVRLWNEQYLLEAFLTCNPHWRVIGALNLLRHAHYQRLKAVCPFLEEHREPGSFWIQRSA